MAARLKKNIEGFIDANGMFRPIRSGNKEAGSRYLPGLAGDNDDISDAEIRKAKNANIMQERYEKREMKSALEDALGSESKTRLAAYVRGAGGIKYDPKDKRDPYKGELAGLSFKETKKRGLAHPKGKKSLDGMRESADEAGYTIDGKPLSTINDFLDALNQDLGGKPVYPFGSIGAYAYNPGNVTGYKQTAANVLRIINKLKKRPRTATKIKKLQRIREMALHLAKGLPKRNPALLTAFAEAAVGLSAAVGLYDRFKGDDKPMKPAKKTARNYVGLQDNPSFERSATPGVHEKNFEKALLAIENGDLSAATKAYAQKHGKAAGFTPNEISRSLQYSKLTHGLNQRHKAGLKGNPATIKQAEAVVLKSNGLIGRALSRHRAGSLYKRQLRLEAAIDRARTARSKAEAKAKKNPAKNTERNSKLFDCRSTHSHYVLVKEGTAYFAGMPLQNYTLGRKSLGQYFNLISHGMNLGEICLNTTNSKILKSILKPLPAAKKNPATVLIWKKPKAAELKRGQKVAYKDTSGNFTKLGTISKINAGLYSVGNAIYTADELRLVKENPAKKVVVSGVKTGAANRKHVLDSVLSNAKKPITAAQKTATKKYLDGNSNIDALQKAFAVKANPAKTEQVRVFNGQRPKGIGWTLKIAGEQNGKDYSIWERKTKSHKKRNPVSSKSFEAFQGRKPTTAFQSPSPTAAPKTLYCLGTLLELRLKGKQNIDFRKETTGKKFFVCADEKNKQLWITGGSIASPNKALAKGEAEGYAAISHIIYETQKVHLGDEKTQGYIHKFGEEGGKEPTLAFDAEGFPIIVSGSYTITPLGIAD